MQRKSRRRTRPKRLLTIPLILSWADAWHERTGEWPHVESGRIPQTGGETWRNIHANLCTRTRGLSISTTLARLLAERRGMRHPKELAALTVLQILAWADEFHQATGTWPTCKTGAIAAAPGETWSGIDASLRVGRRGQPQGSSLARLLAKHRKVRNAKSLRVLTEKLVLKWADGHRRRTGEWPTLNSGQVVGAIGETWCALDTALRDGGRGFPGGSSLARLLAAERGKRHLLERPSLTEAEILASADAWHRQSGAWPTKKSGAVTDRPRETWMAVNEALRAGLRGLSGGSSLARLLAQERGVRNSKDLEPLTVQQIIAWAIAHRERTGKWPTKQSGVIAGAEGTTWLAVDSALHKGTRGLTGITTLRQLLRTQSLSALEDRKNEKSRKGDLGGE